MYSNLLFSLMLILTIISNIINKKIQWQVEKKLNLFCEFILSKYKSKDTIIEACDCQNFIVIKGFSTDSDIIPIQSVADEFSKKYEQYPIKSTIDLIEYRSELSSSKKFTFFFGKDPHNDISLFNTSNFPFGYSNSQGKLLYFYFKHIVDRIPLVYPFTWIKFNVIVTDKNEIDFTIEDDYLSNDGDILKSAILDSFDFNLTEFESILNKMDLEKYILNPSDETLLDKISVSDFIII